MYQYIYAFLAVVTSMLSTTTEAKISTLNDFGSNPSELTASYYQGAQENKNLVVLLHGCVQQGELLAEQSGLLALASAEQFSILLPQQNQNNLNSYNKCITSVSC